jgi:hypothetical protein
MMGLLKTRFEPSEIGLQSKERVALAHLF